MNINDEYTRWISSDEAKDTRDPESLCVKPEFREFLLNRLWRAFMAGAAAGQAVEREAVMERLTKLLEGRS